MMARVFTIYGYAHSHGKAHQLHTLFCECVAIPDTSFIVIIPRARPRDNTINLRYNTMIFLVLYHGSCRGSRYYTTKFRGIIPCFFLRVLNMNNCGMSVGFCF